MIVFIYTEQYIISIKENIMCQNSNMIVFIYMKHNIMRSTKSQKNFGFTL